MGVLNPYARTRMPPLWLDLNSDGKLDLLQGAETRFDDLTPPFAFRQVGCGRLRAGLDYLGFQQPQCALLDPE